VPHCILIFGNEKLNYLLEECKINERIKYKNVIYKSIFRGSNFPISIRFAVNFKAYFSDFIFWIVNKCLENIERRNNKPKLKVSIYTCNR